MIMNKLYFRYATMGAGKSLDLLKTAHNYEERNKRVLLLTSDLDNRFGKKKIASRLGISKKADTFNKETDIYELVYHENQVPYSEHNPINSRKLSCVLIDESQFLTKTQVWQLTDVVDYLNIDVICYGLRSDYQGEPFEGSTYLMTLSDEIEELKTICEYGDKTSMNMRMLDGKPIFEGSQIHIAADESYTPVCRKHFKKERHRKTFIENE
jgi:thymidine kinase